MRKIIISIIFVFTSFVLFAQNTTLTNKIIENDKEYYLYEVQPGEGFMSIGRKFGIAYKDIIEANKDKDEEGLKVGQIIRIPVIEGRNSSSEELKSDKFFYHKIDSGETLFFISRKYDVSINDIVKNNPGSDEVLSIGQELKIPKDTQETPQVNSFFGTIDKHTAPKDSFKYHTVLPKETAYSISHKYGISVEELAIANPGLDPNNISIGSTLRISTKKNIDLGKDESPQKMFDTNYTYHRIKINETLADIAQLYTIPEHIIKQSNGIEDKLPPAGYMLKIPHSYEYAVEVEKEKQEIYTVKKKDDIRLIAEQYQVPIMDIKKANPEVKKWGKLKKGTDLIIPTLSVENVDSLFEVKKEYSEGREELLHYFENRSGDLGDTLKIAFIWPLYMQLNDTINTDKKVNPRNNEITYKTRNPKIIYPRTQVFREFYFGALMALNDLKEKGVTVKIKTYDTERGVANIFRTLKDSSLTEMDLIIGPGFYDQIKPLSDFCLEHHIRMVAPFYSEKESIENNPFLYQIFLTPELEYKYYAQNVAKRYGKSNIIVVKGQSTDERENIFIDALKTALYTSSDSVMSHTISYKEVNYNNDYMSGLSALLRKDMSNLVIIPNKKDKLYTLVVPVIDNYASRHNDFDIKLLGFDEWQNFKKTELENIFNVDCEISTLMYADLYSEDSTMVTFKQTYINYFSTEPSNQYPYPGMLGYDITSYFLKGLYVFGNQLENNLDSIPQNGLCVDFDFKRINNWGGFVNHTLYTIEYTHDFDIKLVE